MKRIIWGLIIVLVIVILTVIFRKKNIHYNKELPTQVSEKEKNLITKFKILEENYGFIHDKRNQNSQYVASRSIGDLATISCAFDLKNDAQIAENQKLVITGTKLTNANDKRISKLPQSIQNEIFQTWFNCLRVLEEKERIIILQEFTHYNSQIPKKEMKESHAGQWQLSMDHSNNQETWTASEK